jgi:protein arginine N-methyltransferase 7
MRVTMSDLLDAARRSLAEAPADPQAWCDLAQARKAAGDRAGTIAAYRRALALRPDDRAIRAVYRHELTSQVPRWHFPMVHDTPRNDAYREALRRAVRPHHHVIEIGTGSGLLAMLAARSGARRVTTCEIVPVIAAQARRVIARNGLSDRIGVICGSSLDLEIGREIDEAGDLLVSEIVGNDFVGEGALAAIADAKARLLNRDATIIPARGHIRAAIVGGDDLERLLTLGRFEGLDLTPFDALAPAVLPIGVDVRLEALSLPFDVFVFDFVFTERFQPEQLRFEVPVTAPGRARGVIQWIALALDDEIRFENAPFDTARSHWEPTLFSFPAPVDVAPGDRIGLRAMHDTTSLMMFLAG